MAKKLADAECYLGPGDYTYRIEEVFDRRLGQVIYELHGTYQPTGRGCLLGEYNTREAARDAMVRQRERDSKKEE